MPRSTGSSVQEICIPGSANLELSLPVADQSARANAELFRRISQPFFRQPRRRPITLTVDEGVATCSGSDGKRLRMMRKSVDLYPLPLRKANRWIIQRMGRFKTANATITLERFRRLSRRAGGRDRKRIVKGWLGLLERQTACPAARYSRAGLGSGAANAASLWQALIFSDSWAD